MKIVVMSDSHGSPDIVSDILYMHKDADAVIVLGDGLNDYAGKELSEGSKEFFFVSGNCDFYSIYNDEEFREFAGKKIFFCHGHKYGVKHGYEDIEARAEKLGADICLFGHTHIPYSDYRGGIYYLNPGAVRSGKFGIITIKNGQILTSLGSLK